MMSFGINYSVLVVDNGWKCGKNLKLLGSDVSDGSKKYGSNYYYNELFLIERIVNGDIDKRFRKFEFILYIRCKFFLKGRSK